MGVAYCVLYPGWAFQGMVPVVLEEFMLLSCSGRVYSEVHVNHLTLHSKNGDTADPC